MNTLKEACLSQQSVLASLRKEVHNLSFIVEHMNKDAKCILDLNSQNLKEAIDSKLSLINFIASEAAILQKSELEAKCELLESSLTSLQSDHKLLIEQQVSSEEAMLDELAKLMTENEKLKSSLSLVASPATCELQDLYSILKQIEEDMLPTLVSDDLQSFVCKLQSQISPLEFELNLKVATLPDSEQKISESTAKFNQLEKQLFNAKAEFDSSEALLKSELTTYQSKLAEAEVKIVQLESNAASKDQRLEEQLCRLQELHHCVDSLTLQINELNYTIAAKDSQLLNLENESRLDKSELTRLSTELLRLKQEFDSEHQKLLEQSEHAQKGTTLRSKLSSLEEAHSCLLDIVKDKEAALTELQTKFDSISKEHEENELRVRELISINAELLDAVEASKRLETSAIAKDDQISALQQALTESKKLADIREAELERIRSERTIINQEIKELSEKMLQFDEIKALNESLSVDIAALKEANESLQHKLTEEPKTGSKFEVILKIEIEKLKETLSRERRLNDLKVIDLEEQVDSLRNELTQVKLAEERRLSLMPVRDNDTENLDPFREAKDKLALLSTNSENPSISTNKRVLQTPAAPPQECLQQ